MNYIEYSAADQTDSVNEAFITQIDVNISQAQSEEERAQLQALRAKMLSDGNALATSLAAFMEEHYKNIGTSLPDTVTFLSKGGNTGQVMNLEIRVR